MTKRKPLEWHDTDDGQLPDCHHCLALMLGPLFTEAVSSVAIKYPTSPAELARRVVTQYHERRHPAEMMSAADRV